MEKELLNKEISSEANVKIDLVDGKLKLAAKYDGHGADAEVAIAVDSDYFLDKLAALIPGKIDDAVLGMLKAALKM